eukprot:gene5167-5686_t
MTENTPFEGNDITEWLQHFRLSELREVLRNMSIIDVADLAVVYGDDELLRQIREQVGLRIFKEFMKARVKTMFSSNPSSSPIEVGHEASLSSNTMQVRSMDLAFLVDCTSAMQSYILAIQYYIVDFVSRHPLWKLRIAFVGYRDFGDEDQLVVHPFTEDASSISNFLQSQRAMGGGDEAEDVLGGLKTVDNLDWQSEVRLLFHVGNAPCHGAEFHGPTITDNYASEYDADSYRPVLLSLYNKQIQYLFGKIKDPTDLMIGRFNQLVNPTLNYITQIPLVRDVTLNLPSVIEHVLNIAESPVFEGTESPLIQWLQHFRLMSSNLQAVLEHMEVHVVEDLAIIYEDYELLERIRPKIEGIVFMQFMAARKRTQVLFNPSATSAETDHESSSLVVKNVNLSLSVEGSSWMVAAEQQEDDSVLAEVFESELGENTSPPTQLMELSVANGEESGTVQCGWSQQVQERTEEDKEEEEDNEPNAEQNSVDLAFLVDCTGSMGLVITKIKDNIVDFVELIREDHPSLKLRIAFVGYRDFDVVADQLAVHPFTEAAAAIRTFLQSQRAMGGGDEAENVLGGLEAVKELDWQSKTRILYHIGDAPCHGAEFHDSKVTDDSSEYEATCYEHVLRSLWNKQIQYFFGKIKDSTDMMIRRLNQLVDPTRDYITQIPINASNMMSEIRSVINFQASRRPQSVKLVEHRPDLDHIEEEGEGVQQSMMEEVTGTADSGVDPSSPETHSYL